MRVEPELTTHLKFRRLKAAVGDVAMECLITIWGHCQQNQRGEYWPGADAAYLEDICFWAGQKGELFRALVECGRPKLGFVVPEEGGLRIHDWEESNSQIIQNWYRNGRGRGAKRAEPSDNRRTTVGQPNVNPTVRHGLTDAAHTAAHMALGQKHQTPCHSATLTGSNGLPDGTQREPNGSPTGTVGQPSDNPTNIPSLFPSINPPPLSALYAQARGLIQTLNALTGSKFNPPLIELDQIVSRLREVEYDVAGVEKMLRHRCACWRDDAKARAWLKPGTLFGANFHDYYGQRDMPVIASSSTPQKTPPPDRTELLETLAAARAQLEKTPADAALQERVRDLELQTA